MRTVVDLTIASIGCVSDNGLVSGVVFIYVIFRLYQESKQYT